MSDYELVGKNFDMETTVRRVLDHVKKPRDREIVSRRLGLFSPRATLEEIGSDLQLTRERIRQLEKSVVADLKERVASGEIDIDLAVGHFSRLISRLGGVVRLIEMARIVSKKEAQRSHQAQIAFLAGLSPKFTVINNSDEYHAGVGLVDQHVRQEVLQHIDTVIDSVGGHGQPLSAKDIREHHLPHLHVRQIQGLASLSKKLAHFNGLWGLESNPKVRPKNIRHKISLVLEQAGKPLHFNEIAKRIKNGPFQRNEVTVQAIHNELINCSDFVLFGRGIYVLKDWGYSHGSVATVIREIIENAEKPLNKKEIIDLVLEKRQVKTATISLNLQNKKRFRKDENGNYGLAS